MPEDKARGIGEAWEPPRSRRERGLEQDRAAGGREHRLIRVDGRDVLGSVWFKRINGYVYAYVRFSAGQRSRAKYLGTVDAASRDEALRQTWAAIHGDGLSA